MKVGIIGAGLSGLSCAHELKRHGIIPTIFEQKNFIGEIFHFQTLSFNNFNTDFWGSDIKYLKKKYNIIIKPQYDLKELITVYPNGTAFPVRGNLGHILKRGTASDSVENQIAQAVNLPIQFNTHIDIKTIKNDFDHIIVATGNCSIAKEFGVFTTTFDAFARIATVSGNFKTDSITIWWNRDYSKNGYAYLVPYSATSARLILVVNGIKHVELDYYWHKFLETEKLYYPIQESKDVEHTVGFVDPIQFENVYFVGVSGGFIDDVFGFAALKAIGSGVLAARSIVFHKNYNDMVASYKKDLLKKHEFRTWINTLDNKKLNKVLSIRDLPVLRQYQYNNPLFKITQLSLFAKIKNHYWRKKQRN